MQFYVKLIKCVCESNYVLCWCYVRLCVVCGGCRDDMLCVVRVLMCLCLVMMYMCLCMCCVNVCYCCVVNDLYR